MHQREEGVGQKVTYDYGGVLSENEITFTLLLGKVNYLNTDLWICSYRRGQKCFAIFAGENSNSKY